MMKLTLADNSFRPISKTSSHVKKEEEEELIGRVVADKVGEIRRELERQCGVCASAKAWDEENKEVRVGRREQNPQAIFSGDRQTDTKLGMGLIRFWTVQGSGDIVDKDSKKIVSTCSNYKLRNLMRILRCSVELEEKIPFGLAKTDIHNPRERKREGFNRRGYESCGSERSLRQISALILIYYPRGQSLLMENLVTIIKALSDYVHSKGLKLGIYSDAEFIRDQRSLPKEGTYDLVATRDISLQNKFHTKEMESIEITTLEDENEIKIVLAESKERKPARKWWSY
ncbi:hypothetical protein IGI04_037842 [Brassica rapa subsp. trilocularis]|uniref:Uncharacterized protein n=1 Tax=Brassica rapa subsp. trilocularis TaxID=1813537 RepID=A0ABQ7LII4_BRACM|nr:hypothetical protein IGI04_037842 [Brassica rapa subsp. trilocularis]